jgi:EAL domain-containing protein (putative c-di-GMP-specific phosphodiesterase class I)
LNLRDLIYPVFHPVVDVNGVPIYYEATLRAYGQRTSDGHGRLLAIAEEMGFVDTLDCIICEAAIDAALTSGSSVGVNVSAFTVQNSLEEFLIAARRGRSLPGGLVIELTETVQPDRIDLMDQFVAEARRLKACIAVDDYGTGHFEASDVLRIQPDFVKIAMPRVHGSRNDAAARKWLVDAVALAQSADSHVIAEGVESEEVLRLMNQLGVRLFQGYLWGIPSHLLPVGQVLRHAARRQSITDSPLIAPPELVQLRASYLG